MNPLYGDAGLTGRRARFWPSPVFLLVVVLTVVGGLLAWRASDVTRLAQFGVFLFVVAGWVVTLCLHEFAHALGAYLAGDRDVAERGYLTLNPLKYSHPVLSIVLPVLFIALGGIGLPGGAVYLHPHTFRTPLWRAVVSLVGPLVNLVAAVVLLAVVRANLDSAHPIFFAGLAFLAFLQLMAAILNLLPIPGLDGYGVIEPYLDPSFRRGAEQVKPFGMLIVFALIQVRSINTAFFDAIYRLFTLSGVPEVYSQTGYALMKFWVTG